MVLSFSQLRLSWLSQPFGIFTLVRRRSAYSSVRIETLLLFFRGLTLSFRRGGVLPPNVGSDDMHRTGAVVFFEANRYGVIPYEQGD